jgi:hypothetical protein
LFFLPVLLHALLEICQLEGVYASEIDYITFTVTFPITE